MFFCMPTLRHAFVLLLFTHAPSRFLALKVIENNCKSEWGVFGDGNFVRTVTNDAAASESQYRVDATQVESLYSTGYLYVQTEPPVAFCMIPKASSSTFRSIVNRIKTGDLLGNYHPPDASDLYRNAKTNVSVVESVFRNPHATRAVFVRDPLSRFLSAYRDKCARAGEDPMWCPMGKPGTLTLRDAVEWIIQRPDYVDPYYHFKPQAYVCDLSNHVRDYNVIGLSGSEKTAQDIKCVLDMANLSQYSGGDLHSNTLTTARSNLNLSEEEELKRYFTPDAARNLIHRYQIDYDTFGFPQEPAWIKDAVGDWYEQLIPTEKRLN